MWMSHREAGEQSHARGDGRECTHGDFSESVGASCLDFPKSGFLRRYWQLDYFPDSGESVLKVFYNPNIITRTHCPLTVAGFFAIAWI